MWKYILFYIVVLLIFSDAHPIPPSSLSSSYFFIYASFRVTLCNPSPSAVIYIIIVFLSSCQPERLYYFFCPLSEGIENFNLRSKFGCKTTTDTLFKSNWDSLCSRSCIFFADLWFPVWRVGCKWYCQSFELKVMIAPEMFC